MFWPICTYLCTLYFSCFSSVIYEQSNNVSTLVRTSNNSNCNLLASAVLLSLSVDASSFVEELFLKDGKARVSRNDFAVAVSESDRDLDKCTSGTWKQYGCYVLTKQHKSQLYGGHLLNDIHIGAAQTLIKIQFPEVGGLKNTVLQNSNYLQPFEGLKNLQVVHMSDINRWIVISTVGCNADEIEIYDSLQN